ncbi:MAG: hypothetical protein WAK37_19365 [Pseudolabrys sp.]
MAPILQEVLAANQAYAASFGDRGKLAMPPARRFASSPAWTPGLIPPSTPALPKAMPM